ncbi:GGDEF domain-containing protein [Deinococcus maricopensis]|uniref:Diguanylate cyclase n=1 Tax=Deinococcus maricopensis (strain DSM 21211 / LMG 22137 / NRRL B-23946 / LB-34) TaxID=709986 RepID=E8U330_DEIML|nr:GGDEF domain-containing protein [Deinococcus maricopensis]ADV65768.1 diguanylate cyclase [Deinococcus maricopensis DSM 21211]
MDQLFVNFCVMVTFAFFRSFTFITAQHTDAAALQAWRAAITVANALLLCHYGLVVQGVSVDLGNAPIAAFAFSNGPLAALAAAAPLLAYRAVQAPTDALDAVMSTLLSIVAVMVIRTLRRHHGPPTPLEGVRNALGLFAVATLPAFLPAVSGQRSPADLWAPYLTEVIGSALALNIITAVMRAHFQVVHKTERYRTLMQLDPLTQLFNRRKFDEDIQQAPSPAYLLLLDLDHFKRVNDTHGHDAGDEVLRVTAQVLREAVRESDRVYRLGGEELAVLLAPCAAEAARGIAERIRRNVEQDVAARTGLPEPVTLSGGLMAVHGDQRTLLRAVDALLYTAKAAGRNRIATAPSTPAPVVVPGDVGERRPAAEEPVMSPARGGAAGG